MTTETLDQRADRLVSQEVHACLSSLVSTLANGWDGDSRSELSQLCEQAMELASPIEDYEEAATEAGFKLYEDGKWHAISQADDFDESMIINYDDAAEVCRENDIEPYAREVYEFWAVSDWFGGRLRDAGEKVENDFAGMTVWARTTTGQMISMDGVIQRIAAELLDD